MNILIKILIHYVLNVDLDQPSIICSNSRSIINFL